MKRMLISLGLLLCSTGLFCAADDASLQKLVQDGIEAIYDLDYGKAQKLFDQIKKDYPKSPVGYGMTAIRAWHELLFESRNLAIYKYGIPTPFDSSELKSKRPASKEASFLEANQALQKFSEDLLNKDPKDALALYFMGVSYENLATKMLTLEGDWLRAEGQASTAEDYHKKALNYNPNLVDAKTSSAVPDYVIGARNILQRFGAVLFFRRAGNKERGIEKLETVISKGTYRATDAMVVLALLETWRGDRKRAISLFKKVRDKHKRSFLCDISLAVGYEETKDFRSAVKIYQELLDNISSKAPGIQPGEIYYRMGKDYLQLHDSRVALEQLNKAVKEKQGDSETKPLAYYEMGCIYKSRNEKERAKECLSKALEFGGSLTLIEDQMEDARALLKDLAKDAR
jgi:tetratricopeptide (TPR) repeat protein